LPQKPAPQLDLLLWNQLMVRRLVLTQCLKHELAHGLAGLTRQRARKPRSLGIADVKLVFHQQRFLSWRLSEPYDVITRIGLPSMKPRMSSTTPAK
jgi:hypothetical protein